MYDTRACIVPSLLHNTSSVSAGMEYLNGQADTGVELEGWSSTVLSNIDEYDGVFEALYEKYGKRMAVSPELQLVFMVGTSAAMYHLTSSMVKHTLSQAGAGAGAAAATAAGDPAAMAEYVRNVDRQYRDEEARMSEAAQAKQKEAQASRRPVAPATMTVPNKATRWQPPPLTTVPPRDAPPVVGLLARVTPASDPPAVAVSAPRPDVVITEEFQDLPDETASLASSKGKRKKAGKKEPAVEL